jgi:hypothetical protein
MALDEHMNARWTSTPIAEREQLLSVLIQHLRPADVKKLAAQLIAKIGSFDDVPGEAREVLIRAMTETGFSLEEYERANGELDASARPPQYWKGRTHKPRAPL